MSENVRPFAWTGKKLEAAYLLAEARLTDEEVASRAGVTGRQLRRWKQLPDFLAKVRDFTKQIEDEITRAGACRRANRLQALNDRWRRMQSVIEERAADPTMKNVPGGKTGLLVRQYKGVGAGDHFQLLEEYEVDTGLLRELREHEKQIAQERGEWVNKQEVAGSGGGPIRFTLEDVVAADRELEEWQRDRQTVGTDGGITPRAQGNPEVS